MTDAEREALRTKVAQAIGEAFGGACMRQDGACAADLEFCGCQRATDAALAVAEPVIREECAKVADEVAAMPPEEDHSAYIAFVIRARGAV